jgi:hypothetical protein
MPSLIDRNPGAFIVLAHGVVFGVIGLEAWVCASGSMLLLTGVMGLILVTAVLIGRAVRRLMDDEDGTGLPAREPSRSTLAARWTRPTKPRRTSTATVSSVSSRSVAA